MALAKIGLSTETPVDGGVAVENHFVLVQNEMGRRLRPRHLSLASPWGLPSPKVSLRFRARRRRDPLVHGDALGERVDEWTPYLIVCL